MPEPAEVRTLELCSATFFSVSIVKTHAAHINIFYFSYEHLELSARRMPVTPKFTISQTESHVVITARVPYVRVSDAEIDIDGHHVSIYCKPYLLKLNFPGELVDDDSSRATYDPIKVGIGGCCAQV